jgi:hypothetical protein
MFPTNNSYYSSTSYPHSSSHCRRPGRSTGGGRNPPKRDGGSSGLPELTPHPWDPVRVPATETSTPLFLPPPLSLLHPALYLLALIFILLTPAGNTASLLVAPPSLSPPQSQQRRRPVQCRSHEGPISAGHTVRVVVVPAVQGGGGGGRGSEHSALSLPGLCSRSVGYYLRMVIPFLVCGVCNIDQLPVGEVGKTVPTGLPPLLLGGIGQKWREGSGVVVVLCSVCW